VHAKRIVDLAKKVSTLYEPNRYQEETNAPQTALHTIKQGRKIHEEEGLMR
jgi:hypothetical protein